jgi:hypothetical protein
MGIPRGEPIVRAQHLTSTQMQIVGRKPSLLAISHSTITGNEILGISASDVVLTHTVVAGIIRFLVEFVRTNPPLWLGARCSAVAGARASLQRAGRPYARARRAGALLDQRLGRLLRTGQIDRWLSLVDRSVAELPSVDGSAARAPVTTPRA